MKIKELTLLNVKRLGTFTFSELGALNLIRGANSTGKTAVLDGVRLALTGGHPVGGTGKKIMELCPSTEMESRAVTDAGDVLESRWEINEKTGGVKQVRGKDNDRVFHSADQFFGAAASGRFAMLGNGKELFDLEKKAASAASELAVEKKEEKRLRATLTTAELTLAKAPAVDGGEALLAALPEKIGARDHWRSIINGLSSEGRNLGAAPGPVTEWKDCDDSEIGQLLAETKAEWRRCTEIARTIVPQQSVDGLKEDFETAEAHAKQVQGIRDEWEQSSAEAYEKAINGHQAALEQERALEAALKSLLPSSPHGPCTCPTCGQGVTVEHLSSLTDQLSARRQEVLEAEKAVSEFEAPVTVEDIKQASKSVAQATERWEKAAVTRSEENLAAAEKISGLMTQLAALKQESENRRLSKEHRQYMEAEGKMTELRNWFAENDTKITAARAYVEARAAFDKASSASAASQDRVLVAKEAAAAAKTAFKTACSKALAKIIDNARGLLSGLVDGEVVGYGSDVVIERQGKVVHWGAMSGSERLAVGCAITSAISTVDGVLLVDEIGVLTPSARARFLHNISEELKAGRIDQAFVVVPDDLAGAEDEQEPIIDRDPEL